MGNVMVVSKNDISELLHLGELRRALSDALIALARGDASTPARVAASTPAGLLAAMPGYVPGLGLAAKLVGVYSGNAALGLPSHQAVIVVFDEDTGSVVAMMDGAEITATRTAMTAAITASAVAKPGAGILAILGAGVQGTSHLRAFADLFPFGEIRIASRDGERAGALASRHGAARAVPTFEAAVLGADIVCCCTDAAAPVVNDAWINPGTHVSSVGFGRELDAETIEGAQVFVESHTALEPPPAGAQELQGRSPSQVTEIGAVLDGRAPGRISDDAVTVYKSVGDAAEDVAAASVVLRRARALGRGFFVSL
jgi:alanine dehydrogenase